MLGPVRSAHLFSLRRDLIRESKILTSLFESLILQSPGRAPFVPEVMVTRLVRKLDRQFMQKVDFVDYNPIDRHISCCGGNERSQTS